MVSLQIKCANGWWLVGLWGDGCGWLCELHLCTLCRRERGGHKAQGTIHKTHALSTFKKASEERITRHVPRR